MYKNIILFVFCTYQIVSGQVAEYVQTSDTDLLASVNGFQMLIGTQMAELTKNVSEEIKHMEAQVDEWTAYLEQYVDSITEKNISICLTNVSFTDKLSSAEYTFQELSLKTRNSLFPVYQDVMQIFTQLENYTAMTRQLIEDCNSKESVEEVTNCLIAVIPQLTEMRNQITSAFSEKEETYLEEYNIAYETLQNAIKNADSDLTDYYTATVDVFFQCVFSINANE
ncbi:hypothetical protein L9F63_009106 [Diploptera punctata]|uniref:Uncharacterized protein n=1 Tax=Diploptera punctata TaxID=6984 RepID=A0AAD7Z4G0_DIPPU|nr:hypothetical protein L9F63_009106 [Diploptera punctata]